MNLDERISDIPNVGPMRWEPGDEPTPHEAVKQLITDVLAEVKPERDIFWEKFGELISTEYHYLDNPKDLKRDAMSIFDESVAAMEAKIKELGL